MEFVLSAALEGFFFLTAVMQHYYDSWHTAQSWALPLAPLSQERQQTIAQQRLFAEVCKLDAVPQKKEKKRGNDEVGSNTLLASETNIRRVSSDTTNWLHGSVGADLLLCF